MNSSKTDLQLLFSHEVLRARLDIRDFFLKYAVREVYENIGQVLSVVRMQLAVLEINNNLVVNEDSSSPGKLVSQSIKDLRAMCKSLYPDTDIIKEEGFTEAINNMLAILYPDTKNELKIRGIKKEIQPELILIIFKMIKEILTSIKESKLEVVRIVMSYGKNQVKLTIGYSGGEVASIKESTGNDIDTGLTFIERAKLIKGKLSETKSKSGINQVTFTSPLKFIML